MNCNKCNAPIAPHYDNEGIPTTHEDWWTACTGWIATCLPCWRGFDVDDSDVCNSLPADHPFHYK
jgi:hypothetical protein